MNTGCIVVCFLFACAMAVYVLQLDGRLDPLADKLRRFVISHRFQKHPTAKNFYVEIKTRAYQVRPRGKSRFMFPGSVHEWMEHHSPYSNVERFSLQLDVMSRLLDAIRTLVCDLSLDSIAQISEPSLRAIAEEFDANTARVVQLVCYSNGVKSTVNEQAIEKIINSNKELVSRVGDFFDSLQEYAASTVSTPNSSAGCALEALTCAMKITDSDRKPPERPVSEQSVAFNNSPS